MRRLCLLTAVAALIALPLAASAQPTATIITHGLLWQTSATPHSPDWAVEMAGAVCRRTNGGVIMHYRPSDGRWEQIEPASGLGCPSPSGQHYILVFDWAAESDALSNGPNWNYAEAAADALYAALRDPRDAQGFPIPGGFLDGRTIHFIGHSRGTCVNSEVVRRLGAEGIQVDHVTTLDPHPVDGESFAASSDPNPDWNDPMPRKWSNVTFADNYWRRDTTSHTNDLCDFDGIDIPDAYSIVLTGLGDSPASGSDVDACTPTSILPCLNEHSRVHAWYHFTIDHAASVVDGCDYDPEWWSHSFLDRETTGYVRFASQAGGGAAQRNVFQGPGQCPGAFPVLFNGTFDKGSYAGWSYHGGGGDATLPVGVEDGYLTFGLSAGVSRTHNRFFLPADASTLSFSYRVSGLFGLPSGSAIEAEFLQNGVRVTPIVRIPLVDTDAWTTATASLDSVAARDQTYEVRLTVDMGGAFLGQLQVDNVEVARAITETAKLLASDGAAGDVFGWSVAVSGDSAIVGAHLDDDPVRGTAAGSAYIFSFNGSSWVQQQKLFASDGTAGDRFGQSVAISGETAIVGAYADDDPVRGANSGSAYIFRFNGSSWVQQQKLLASDGAAGDQLGVAVAISGDTAIVGANADDDLTRGTNAGSAYIFRFNGSSWVQQQKLLASDGASHDRFGTSVAISGETAAAGSPLGDDLVLGTDAGAAYVFRSNGSSWQQQKLLAADGAAGDNFGQSVTVSGNTMIVGAYRDNDPARGTDAGSAYVFSFDGSSWAQQQKLLASDGAAFDFFGVSVGVTHGAAIVGAYFNDDPARGADAGSAYVFRFDGSSWAQQQILLSCDSAARDFFGVSVGISSDTAVVGSYLDDDAGLGADAGSAHIFQSDYGGAPPCPCERTGDSPPAVDVFDLLAYLDLWFSGDAAAELDGQGGVDVFDLLAFLDCWFPASAGGACP